MRKKYFDNIVKCYSCHTNFISDLKYNYRCNECKNMKSRQLDRVHKFEAIKHYSNGMIECKCCKENIFQLLTIDHLNNDGMAHRRRINRMSVYRWLNLNNFPEGFQVLCFNCNSCKGFQGECIHKLQEVS
jgi:hypothetical protein